MTFSARHTAANIAEAKNGLMKEWGIRGNVISLVTLNLTPELEQICTRARRIVQLFKSSTIAKEKLAEIQVQMGRPS